MCLIIHKLRGEVLDTSDLVNGFANNPDGWGVMWAKDNRVHVKKGFELKELLDLCEALQDEALTIHTRWATHGEISLANCHPFKVTKKIYLMHNGVVYWPERNKEMSDTWHFVQDFLQPILRQNPELFGTLYLEDMIEACVGTGNKFVLLRNDGEAQIIGESRGTWFGNTWYSNLHSLVAPTPKKEKSAAAAVGAGTFFTPSPVTKALSFPPTAELRDDEKWITGWEEFDKKDPHEVAYEGFPATLEDLQLMDEEELEMFQTEFPDVVRDLIYLSVRD